MPVLFSLVLLATSIDAAAAENYPALSERISRLDACRPSDDAQAVKCLDQTLTRREKAELRALEYEDIDYAHAGALLDAIYPAWMEGGSSHLAGYYYQFDDPARELLRSYWLKMKGCPTEIAKRAAIQATLLSAVREAEVHMAADPDLVLHPEWSAPTFRPCAARKAR